MKLEISPDGQSSFSPGLRQRHVYHRREHIRKTMKAECRLVTEHSLLVEAEPQPYKILVFHRREMHEPVDAPADSRHPVLLHVLRQERPRVTRSIRLRLGEVPALTRRDLVQRLPVGMSRLFLYYAFHAVKLING